MFEIVVQGEVGSAVRSAFDDLVVTVGGGRTTLRGELADQFAVYEVLARVHDFGLELLEMRRLDPESAGDL